MKRYLLFTAFLVASFLFASPSIYAISESDCQSQGGSCENKCDANETSLGSCVGGRGGTILCCKPPGGTTCSGTCINPQVGCATGTTRNPNKVCSPANFFCCEANSASSGANSNTTGANSNSVQNVPITIGNPLNYDSVEGFLTAVLGGIQRIIAVLAVVFIVIGGLLYITSAGKEGQIKLAKSAITAALIGFAIAIAAPSFLKEIAIILQWGEVNNAQVEGALSLTQIATRVLTFLLSIVGILALIMLIIGAIMYFFAAGNETRQKAAKSIVISSLIGIAIALASLVLITQIANFFS